MEIRDAKLALQKMSSSREPMREFSIGVLAAIEFADSARVSSKPDFSWVKEFNQGQSTFQILNRAVPHVPGSMVKIGFPEKPPFQRQILGPYDETVNYPGYIEDDGGGSLNIGPHGRSHQYPSEASPGTDPVMIFMPAISPFKTSAVFDMTISIRPYVYRVGAIVKFFPGVMVNLTPYIPVAGTLYCLVALNKSTNHIVTVTGTPAVHPVQPSFPPIPEGHAQSSYVRLYAGQTQVSMSDDVTDIRSLFAHSDNPTIPNPTQQGQIIYADENGEWSAGRPVVNQYGEIITSSKGIVVI